MRFRTEYAPTAAGFTLNPEKPVLLLGSCFADNITRRMRFCRWDAENPFGVLFNPLSIASILRISLCNNTPHKDIDDSIFENDGHFHSWLFDSKKSGTSRETVYSNIEKSVTAFKDKLENSEALFITFGTSWCYFLNGKEDYIVANCHKQPQQLFTRRRLGINEITDTWRELAQIIHDKYPKLQIIFTVSPVRHLKDGFEGNARSKATLLLAVENICSHFDFCHYFPAYEIVNDDLRDYRFYASDLTHPSDTAVDYIWEILQSTYLDQRGISLLKEGEKTTRRELHRSIIS